MGRDELVPPLSIARGTGRSRQWLPRWDGVGDVNRKMLAQPGQSDPGFSPTPDENIWLVGARDLDPLESEALSRSAIRRIPAETFNATTVDEIVRRRQSGGQIYLHLDLDVLDPIEGCANGFAVVGGVTTSQLCDFCAALHRQAPPTGMTISAYDPAQDNDRRICHAALQIVDAVLNP
jgi:arginase